MTETNSWKVRQSNLWEGYESKILHPILEAIRQWIPIAGERRLDAIEVSCFELPIDLYCSWPLWENNARVQCAFGLSRHVLYVPRMYTAQLPSIYDIPPHPHEVPNRAFTLGCSLVLSLALHVLFPKLEVVWGFWFVCLFGFGIGWLFDRLSCSVQCRAGWHLLESFGLLPLWRTWGRGQ